MSSRLKKTYIEKNTNSDTKLLIIAEHAGNLIPSEFDNLGLNDDDRRRHISYDIGVFEICRILSETTKEHIIMSRYSRLLVDLNRGINSPDCIRHLSDGTIIPRNKSLEEKDKIFRLKQFYHPFHKRLFEIILTKKIEIIISIHSFTPKLFVENVPRPWHCGILYDCSENLGKHCIDFLKQKYKLMVGDNEPYGVNNSSDYIISKFGDKQSIPAIIIEIRQDLISDFKGQKKWSNIVKNLITSCLYYYNN